MIVTISRGGSGLWAFSVKQSLFFASKSAETILNELFTCFSGESRTEKIRVSRKEFKSSNFKMAFVEFSGSENYFATYLLNGFRVCLCVKGLKEIFGHVPRNLYLNTNLAA